MLLYSRSVQAKIACNFASCSQFYFRLAKIWAMFSRQNTKWSSRFSDLTVIVFFFTASLGSLCMAIGLIMSPLTVGVCKRKSTRLTGVIGGLVLALGCLFSSFANQFHQLFFSHAIMTGKKMLTNLLYTLCFIRKESISRT